MKKIAVFGAAFAALIGILLLITKIPALANDELDQLHRRCYNEIIDYQACVAAGELSMSLKELELATRYLGRACREIKSACGRLYGIPGMAEWRSEEFVAEKMQSISDVVEHLIYNRQDDTEMPTYIEAYFLANASYYLLYQAEPIDGCLSLNAAKRSLEALPRDHELTGYVAWDIAQIGFNGWCNGRYLWDEAAHHLIMAVELQVEPAVNKLAENDWAIQSAIDFVNWRDSQNETITLPFSCSGRVSPRRNVWVDAYEQGPIASQSLAQFVGIDNVLQRTNAVMGLIRNIDCDFQPWTVQKSDIIMHNPFGFYSGTAQGGGFVVTTFEDSTVAAMSSTRKTRFSAIQMP